MAQLIGHTCRVPEDHRDPATEARDVLAPPSRDRDEQGRARNARPRDELGRPLPWGATGTPRLVEGQLRTPDETIELAQQLLDEGRPFHAHEVFEDAWKSAEAGFRAVWKGYAQVAVGLTHWGRGNRRGAVALLRRGAGTLAPFGGSEPYGLRVDAAIGWATELADRIERDGLAGQLPRLSLR